MTFKDRKDISIVLSGEAGQGIQTVERLLLRLFKLSGFHVFSYSEFMSRIRGGNNSTEIRISSERVNSFVGRIDFFVTLHAGSMERFYDRISQDTLIAGDPAHVDSRYRDGNHTLVEFPLAEMAKAIGGPLFANIIFVGIFACMFNLDLAFVREELKRFFSRIPDDMMQKNIAAVEKGCEIGKELFLGRGVRFDLEKSDQVKGEMLLNGSEAIGLGGLAGGCNFVSSYPMSPSTDVLLFFARNAEKCGLVVEQAEDEISAINMAIGSWYAGGRAMVTTSGGGFALMAEALSLAGAVESPIVIHLGQRPGPATGLPTRTEQGDLLFALYAGHGEFPRVLFAPGDFEEGFRLAQRAFYISDKYQVPVIILSDQFFIDSNYNLPDVSVEQGMARNHIVKTEAEYLRFKITETGISPRGIPGFGEGIVCIDSDEHTEGGYITEDFAVRTAMVDKRLRKLDAMKEDILPPRLFGPDDYSNLIIGWGSTLNVVREALTVAGRRDTAFLHFSQLYPLHESAARLIARAKKKIIIENNATSQFGALLKLHAGIQIDRKILKYNGMPFMLEEVVEAIKGL
jgi:2-oxoglutarate/2-oxoacid ferredoxin oxidoreductase subunit alpha